MPGLAVRHGGICYLDETVEARQDTTVAIHPLTDARRIVLLEKHNEFVPASRCVKDRLIFGRNCRTETISFPSRTHPTLATSP